MEWSLYAKLSTSQHCPSWVILVERLLVFMGFFWILSTCKNGNGSTIRLWKNKWIEPMLKDKRPWLFSFSTDQDITIKEACSIANEDIYDHFHLSLSIISPQQSIVFLEILMPIMKNNENDLSTFPSNQEGYSSKKVCTALAPAEQAPAPATWI